jgi:hypothetical protein
LRLLIHSAVVFGEHAINGEATHSAVGGDAINGMATHFAAFLGLPNQDQKLSNQARKRAFCIATVFLDPKFYDKQLILKELKY